jgi:hypothetical protein
MSPDVHITRFRSAEQGSATAEAITAQGEPFVPQTRIDMRPCQRRCLLFQANFLRFCAFPRGFPPRSNRVTFVDTLKLASSAAGKGAPRLSGAPADRPWNRI